ncbi:acyloxyacyl hydrolase [Azospirillum sp.]|uniref:acyloxyacyl hydrolase n=1 Tax=Azospirillum sp. TaxID=34012 RepID=UPI002D32BC05|nr:acyloxyacyl hydrolase [Azospirillum sp.]HYD69265.1 acyloxyacyl hydrolase [Azospirillum sp.]
MGAVRRVRRAAGLLAAASAAAVAWFCTAASAASTSAPDLISVGFGAHDAWALRSSTDTPRRRSNDMRLEYRFGTSLLPFTDPYVRFHPWVGLEANTDGMLYGAVGILADIPVGPLILTPGIGAGLWRRGGSKHLGSAVDFRSTLELGYRFENGVRLSAYVSHMSNAGLTETNPGADTVGAYLHVPVSFVFGR